MGCGAGRNAMRRWASTEVVVVTTNELQFLRNDEVTKVVMMRHIPDNDNLGLQPGSDPARVTSRPYRYQVEGRKNDGVTNQIMTIDHYVRTR